MQQCVFVKSIVFMSSFSIQFFFRFLIILLICYSSRTFLGVGILVFSSYSALGLENSKSAALGEGREMLA